MRSLDGRTALLVWSLLYPAVLFGADKDPLLDGLFDPGHGSVTLALQMIEVNEFDIGDTDVDIGSVSTRSAYIELEYAVASRWLVKLGLPYIKKKYDGPAKHNPMTLVPPRPEVPFIDDGSYHGNLQDGLIGVHYLLASQPLQIEPFVNVFIPTHDYPHFAQAAVGQNLWKVETGVEATHWLPFSFWYYRVAASYTFVEETLGVNVNHFRLNGELGYFLSPRFAVHGFFHGKDGRGDDATDFPPTQRTDERWYQHDRTSRHSYLNVGIGADWYFHENYELFGSVLHTVWGETVHKVDWAASLGITRYF
jgi:hypothetical protein